MIVVDVGCHPLGPEDSVYKLIDRFEPELLFGFDPYPEVEEGLECVRETLVVRRRVAAWVWDGVLDYAVDGISSSVHPAFMVEAPIEVDCFDLAEWIRVLPPVEIVLKLDAEGAEFPLLTDLHLKGLDARIELLLVEWHGEGRSGFPLRRDGSWQEFDRGELLERLRCPVEDWE
jgi:hypothetical protein